MSHENAYRPRAPIHVDLSRAPQHLRDAVDASVEWRPGEVVCRFTNKTNRQGTQAGCRVFTALDKTVLDGVAREMVEIRVNDMRGREPVAQLQISPDDLEPFIARLIEIYRVRGGRLRPLLDAYQGKSNT
jgi:hypothetical protein